MAAVLFTAAFVAVTATPLKAAPTESEQAVIDACSKNKAYQTWMSRCKNNKTSQAACYCAAAALIRCYLTAVPDHPSHEEWQKAYDKNMKQAEDLGTKCFNN